MKSSSPSGRGSSDPHARSKKGKRGSLHVERLEDRIVMDYTLSFANDVLSIVSSAGDVSDLRFGYELGVFALVENGTNAGTFQGTGLPAGVSIFSPTQLVISDSFFSDPARRISVELGDGNDRVELISVSGTRDRVTIDMGTGSGSQTLAGSSTANTFTILGTQSVNIGGIVINQVDVVDGGAQAANTVDLVNGLTTADLFTLGPGNSFTSSGMKFQQIEAIDGRGGDDTVLGTAGDDIFSLSAPSVLFPASTNVQVGTLRFGNIESIQGGGGSDSVGGIDTGSGADETVTLQTGGAFSTGGLAFSQIAVFDARGGNDTVVGTSGDEEIDLLNDGTGTSKSVRAQSVQFQRIEVFQGGDGNNVLNGIPVLNDLFTVTGTQAGRSQGIQFEQIDRFNPRSGGAELALDPALAGTTPLDFAGLTNTAGSVQILGTRFDDVLSIDANSRPLSQTGLTRLSSPANNAILANGINVTEVSSINVDTVVGTTGNDDVSLTGVGGIRYRGINFSSVKEFDGQNPTSPANDTDTVRLETGVSPLTITFGATDPDKLLTNLLGSTVDFRNIEVVNPEGKNLILVGPRTATASTTANAITANGIAFTRVIDVNGVTTLNGTTGNDSLAVLAAGGLTLNGVNYANVQTFNGLAGTDRVTFDIPGSTGFTFAFPTENITNNSFSILGVNYQGMEEVGTLGLPVTLNSVNFLTRTGFRSYLANAVAFSNVQSALTNGVGGTSGNDKFYLNLDKTVRFSPTPDGDTVITTQGPQAILGNGGDDEVFGPASSATERYQLFVQGQNRAVRAPGGFLLSQVDTIRSATANDTLFGTTGDDTFSIGPNNTIQIDTSNILAFSTSFPDFRVIDGLEGNDTFVFSNDGSWSGTLVGGAGVDRLQGDANGTTFVLNSLTGNRILDQVGPNGSAVPQLGGTFREVEAVLGGAGNDTFRYQGGGFSGSAINGGGQTVAGSAINNTDRGDILDLSGLAQGVLVNFDQGVVQVGLSDTFSFQDVETVLGTPQGDRFVRLTTSANNRVMVGGGGADLFQVGNNSTDVLVFDALDQINSFDQARDVFIAEVPGTPVPPPGVFNPSRPITNTNNIWFSQSVANQGFINATNFPLVAEAYVRYLYRLLIGGDPDTANGARIVSFWTQRVASQSLTSFDLVRAFLTQNVANIGGTNPPPAQYFADYFFNGFARREIGDPFAGQDRARLADMVKGGMSLETVSRLAGFTVSDSTLARAWSREYMYNLLSTQLDEALREDASRAFLATPPASRTLRSSINAVTDLLRRDQRPWINALLTIINGTEGLRGAIRLASVENPVRFSPLMDAASLPSTKLGSFEPGGWFLDVPPGRARELFPTGVNFGVPSDTPVPGDWNGDGNDDFGVFRQGSWFLDTNGTEGWQAGDTSVSFGVGSDAPVAGDWSGQGRSRLGVFRQGTWFLDSNNSLGWQGDDTTATFGVAGDTPFVGDWNGDGVTDLGVRRGNVFFLDTNGVRGWQGNDTSFADTFGAGRILVSDFNGDGRDDIAVVNGNRWRIDFAGPFGFQPDADAELFFDSNEGVPVIMARSPISLTRQQSVPAGSTASLLTGPILFSAPAPSTGSTSTTSSTGGTNSSSSESGSPSSGTGTVGQPLLLGRSRLPFGSAGETGPTLTIDELEESEQWMLAESDSDAIDRVFAELG